MSTDTGMQRIDSHQHFWLRERGDYHWLTPELAPIYDDFLPADLEPYLKNLGISKTILVQAAATEAETDFMLSLAEQHEFIAGVIGWVDMESPSAVASIHRMAANPFFKGIRPMIQEIEDERWMLSEQLHPAFQAVQDLDLCFEALVKPPHLDYLQTLLQRYPDLKLVIDHGAKPDIASGDTAKWAKDMAWIADNTQAYCKLSGLITEAGENPSYDDVRPQMQHLLDCFGARRLMWGSDWPVLNMASGYPSWFTVCDEFIAALDAGEQRAIWSETAAEFYSL